MTGNTKARWYEIREDGIHTEMKVECNVCGKIETAKLYAESKEEMTDLENDVCEYFICEKCHNDPDKREAILDVLGIEDPQL